jgi:hypothetical protein
MALTIGAVGRPADVVGVEFELRQIAVPEGAFGVNSLRRSRRPVSLAPPAIAT